MTKAADVNEVRGTSPSTDRQWSNEMLGRGSNADVAIAIDNVYDDKESAQKCKRMNRTKWHQFIWCRTDVLSGLFWVHCSNIAQAKLIFVDNFNHYNDVIMTTIASQSPASRLFTRPFIQTQIKENIKAPRHWPLCGEFTGTGAFPAQRASYAENVSIWWRHHVVIHGPCDQRTDTLVVEHNKLLRWWCHPNVKTIIVKMMLSQAIAVFKIIHVKPEFCFINMFVLRWIDK